MKQLSPQNMEGCSHYTSVNAFKHDKAILLYEKHSGRLLAISLHERTAVALTLWDIVVMMMK